MEKEQSAFNWFIGLIVLEISICVRIQVSNKYKKVAQQKKKKKSKAFLPHFHYNFQLFVIFLSFILVQRAFHNRNIGSFLVKWTKAEYEPSQILMKLFHMKGICKIRLKVMKKL